MKINIEYNKKTYKLDSNSGIDISIPRSFRKDEAPKFYDTETPYVDYFQSKNKKYNLENSGPCNVPIIKFNIHCSGTHTECANHIIKNAPTINKIKNISFIPSQLITIEPIKHTNEGYHCNLDENDCVITKAQLSNSILDNDLFNDGLIIRTIPNDIDKCNRDYNLKHHPFLSNDAILFLKNRGIKHLIIDTPSIDRYDDNGKLGNHNLFFREGNSMYNTNTITEFVYIPNDCKDGKYFVNLGVSNFILDAAPSRPIIFPIL